VIFAFRRAYKRRDKLVATGLVKFIAHLVNQQVRVYIFIFIYLFDVSCLYYMHVCVIIYIYIYLYISAPPSQNKDRGAHEILALQIHSSILPHNTQI
jgi:hypothetical protein